MKIGRIFSGLLNESSGGHSYGCVMLSINITKVDWEKIQSPIDDDDIYLVDGDRSYGLEPHNEAHVTLLYGLHEEVGDSEVEDRVNLMTYPDITLNKVSLFENDDFDVLKFDVNSKELDNMNEVLKELPFTNDYDEYHPHITIGYLKKGTGKKYVKMLNDNSEEITIKTNKIIYSKVNDELIEYKK